MSKEPDAEGDPAARPPDRSRPASEFHFARVLLKITGESFTPQSRLRQVTREIAAAARTGCEIAIVVGGGNIMRGRQAKEIDRISADQAGMVATVVNGIVLEHVLSAAGVPVRHYAAFEIAGVVPRYSRRSAVESLGRGQVVVLSGGTGNPLFTTDTAAALRAREIGAEVLLKGTKVRGVYSADPEQDPKARFLPHITFDEVIKRQLRVMDSTAFQICEEARIPIIVFHLFETGNLAGVIRGAEIGSKVC